MRGDADHTGAHIITDLIQIIYASQPFGYDVPTLSGILLNARDNNTRDQITGALVCRQDIYLQLLEGPKDAVDAAVKRIGRDDRHANMTVLVSEPVGTRIFGDWAMLHDPATSLIWTQAELEGGILERTPPEGIQQMFKDLAQKVKNDPSV